MYKKIILAIISLFFLASCSSKKDLLYYQDVQNNSQSSINFVTNEIQINDILYIKVDALIQDSAKPFNLEINNTAAASIQNYKVQGYLVTQDGTIVFPILGPVKAAGKTPVQLQKIIKDLLDEKGYIKDANVNVRVINSKVTILGEVKSPGTYSFEEQNITLNQALGYAGDLTIYGKRNDILLIREVNGTRSYIKVDLTKSDLMNSPYYYVKQNDIIIVNPNGARVMSSGYLNNIGSIIGILSLVATIVLLIRT